MYEHHIIQTRRLRPKKVRRGKNLLRTCNNKPIIVLNLVINTTPPHQPFDITYRHKNPQHRMSNPAAASHLKSQAEIKTKEHI